MSRAILHVDLDSFYASVEELRRPEIRDKPVVTCAYSGRTEDSGAVSSANYRARELGIRSGMPIAFAKRLAKDNEVVFLPQDLEHYRSVSGRIMDLLEGEAEAFQQVSVDEAYLDITQSAEGNWKKAEGIARELKSKIKEQEKLTCSIGVGPNKLVAKIASKHKKPDGLTVITESEVGKFMEPLPVSKIHGIGEKTEEVLAQMGVKTGGDLARSDFNALAEKFGKNKAKLLQEKARGIDESPVHEQEAKQVSRIGTLKEDTRDLDEIFGKVKQLATDLKKKIKEKDISFRTISVIAIDTTLETQTRSETVSQTDDLDTVIETARRLLKKFLEENPDRKLRRVGIRVSNLTHKGAQLRLMDF